jgi:hypothetical protein
MAKRTGITTSPSESRRRLEEELRNVRAFRLLGPFPSRRKARQWEDDHGPDWERDSEDATLHGPFARWWGYELEHDGPSSSAVHRAVDEVVKKWS